MYPLDLLWEIKGLCKAGVPNLRDLMPDDLRWRWCNHNDRNKVHNKCVLESSQIHPHSQGHGKTVCYKSSPWCQNGCEVLIKGLFLHVLGGLPEDGQQLLALLEAPPNEENCPAWRGCIQRWSSAGFSRSTPLNPTQDSDRLQERLLFRGLRESSSSSAQSNFHHSSATVTEKHSLIKFCSNLCLGVCCPGSPIWDSHQETDFIGA